MATSPMSLMMGGGKLNSPGASGPTPGSASPSESFSPSSLLGEDAEMGGPEQAKSDGDLTLVQEIRTMEQTLQSVASRYPNAASTVRRAITSIRDVLKQVVSPEQSGGPESGSEQSPGEEEPPAPSTTA